MDKTIASLQHPFVKHAVKLRQNRDYRYEHRLVGLEGVKIISEVCANIKAKSILTVEPELVPDGVKAEEIILVKPEIIQKISGALAPEGIMAFVEMPMPAKLQKCRRIIALDGVGDPGNVGTLLRTALALGWDGAFLLDGCADPYNDKALRAARGASFRLPTREGNWQELDQLIKTNRLKPFAADLEGVTPSDVSLDTPLLLVLGSEAHGLSSESRQRCQKVVIPMSGKMESLNVAVAGGILMYWLQVGKI